MENLRKNIVSFAHAEQNAEQKWFKNIFLKFPIKAVIFNFINFWSTSFSK